MKKHPFANEIKRIAMYNRGRHLSKLLFRAIYSELGISRNEVIEKNRKRDKTEARAIYIILLHENGVTHKSSTHFINRDVSTYHYNKKLAKNLLATKDVKFTNKYKRVKAHFNKLRAEATEPNELDVPHSIFNRV